jgi:hypothetical protein
MINKDFAHRAPRLRLPRAARRTSHADMLAHLTRGSRFGVADRCDKLACQGERESDPSEVKTMAIRMYQTADGREISEGAPLLP